MLPPASPGRRSAAAPQCQESGCRLANKHAAALCWQAWHAVQRRCVHASRTSLASWRRALVLGWRSDARVAKHRGSSCSAAPASSAPLRPAPEAFRLNTCHASSCSCACGAPGAHARLSSASSTPSLKPNTYSQHGKRRRTLAGGLPVPAGAAHSGHPNRKQNSQKPGPAQLQHNGAPFGEARPCAASAPAPCRPGPQAGCRGACGAWIRARAPPACHHPSR